MSVPYPYDPVYRQHGLLFLFGYACQYPHSAQWMGALMILLAREGARHG
jgi:hypothetical protein